MVAREFRELRRRFGISIVLLSSLALLGSQRGDRAGGSDPESTPPLEAPILFGTVRYYPESKRIELDGSFNLNRGLLEFLACGQGVNSHESLLSLDVDPTQLNLALILMGLKSQRRPTSDADTGFLPGDRVVLTLRFPVRENGIETLRELRVEDAIINQLSGEPMRRVGFVYTGSSFIRDRRAEGEEQEIYAPVRTRQYIALVHRAFAILDNPLELPYPDPEYAARTEVLPNYVPGEPVPVTLTIRHPRRGEIDATVIKMPLKPKRRPQPK